MEIFNFSQRKGYDLRQMKEEEDPWLILNDVMELLNPTNLDSEGRPNRPIIECSCGSSDQPPLMTNLEFINKKYQKSYSNKKMNCDSCDGRNESRNRFLPDNFFLRIKDENQNSLFADSLIPRIDRYYVAGVIQEKNHHFRTIRMLSANNSIVYDGKEEVEYRTIEDRKRLTNSEGWNNYIISYSIRYNERNNSPQETPG
jgi:hypothetical protein